ncbi:hypothetical protein FLL49_13520 [Enterococcus faecalis]|nr:hypothetical protein FLL49_13520 [Enterococcus faecalis]
MPPIFVIFYGYVSLLNDTIFWRGLGWVREIDKKDTFSLRESVLKHCNWLVNEHIRNDSK